MRLAKIAAISIIWAGTMAMPVLAAEVKDQTSAVQVTSMSTGTVKKIDREQSKLTVQHGPLANLEMPAMTMVFRIASKELPDSISAGDKVNFVAEKLNGTFVITKIERAI